MKKQILSSLIAFSIIFTPALRADGTAPSSLIAIEEVFQPANNDEPGSSLDDTTSLAVEPETEEVTEEEGAPVGKASTEGMSAAKKRQWTNIAIAACAVAVAVTALILVSSNDGRKAKKH